MHPSNGIQLGFLVPDHSSQPAFLHQKLHTDGYVISLEVNEASQVWQQAQAMDLEIAMQLKREDWGQIHFMVKDPAGFTLDLVEHIS